MVRILVAMEGRCREARRRLVRSGLRRSVTDRPNKPEEWDRLYSAPVEPVLRLTTEVAKALEALSRPGDTLLETGCGSATLSAELATVGRKIELGDFSQPILDRAVKLFEASRLPLPIVKLADLTKSLPWDDRSVDITWSSGVLEHWTDEELQPIVAEMKRVSRRRVISLVPYAGSVFYRWGKWAAEQTGTWSYGRELPRETLRPVFERAGLRNITERTIWADVSLEFLSSLESEIQQEAKRWWCTLPADDPLRRSQGYLLVTVGETS